MRRLRFLILVFFAVTAVGFAVYKVKNLAVKDTEAPQITCDSDTIEVGIEAGEKELLAGMKADDNKDGDVTDSLVVVSKSKFFEKGKLRVNYAAFDKKSNVGTYTREVTYTDYISPRFSLSAPLRFSVETSDTNLKDILKVNDCLDGDISGLIKTRYGEDRLAAGEAGTQEISFQATNSAGDTVQFSPKLEFLEKEEYNLPHPMLSDYVIYTKVNQEPDLSQYLIGVSTGGNAYLFDQASDDSYGVSYERDEVSVSSEADYSTPGTYSAVYTLKQEDEDGNHEKLGSTTLYIIVEE